MKAEGDSGEVVPRTGPGVAPGAAEEAALEAACETYCAVFWGRAFRQAGPNDREMVREAMRAALAAYEAAMWRPADEAPRDGRQILAETIHGDIELTEYFVYERDVYEPVEGELFRRRREIACQGWNGNTPRIWRPLPKPPAVAES